MVTFLQRTFTSLVHAHAGRTQGQAPRRIFRYLVCAFRYASTNQSTTNIPLLRALGYTGIGVTMIEYLQLLLAPHIVWAGVLIFFAFKFRSGFSSLLAAITDRIRSVKGYRKTKEGHELTFSESQQVDAKSLPNTSATPPEVTHEKNDDFTWPEDTTEDIAEIKTLVKAERSSRYLWEYNYLNFFFQRHTQYVLDWFVERDCEIPLDEYHGYWKKFIKSERERKAVLDVLLAHFMLEIKENRINVTPKGREYHEWRGPMPPFIAPGA